MSDKRLRGAQARIKEMGEGLPEEEKATNKSKAQTTESKKAATPVEIEIDRLEKEKLSTTVSPSTKLAIAKIQQDAIRRGWKKPKIGEILDEAVLVLLEQRGLDLQ